MRRVLLTALLALMACSPGEEAGVTTATPAPTTTLSSPVTSQPVATTTPPTTTTTASTTTTAVTTTTVSLGVWAELPLIVTGFGALGWWDGTEWIRADDAGELPVEGGEHYQVAALGVEATTIGGPQQLVCDPLLNLGVELADPQLLGDWPGPYGVAISAPWELHPHLFEPFTDDGTYSAIAAGLLAQRGLVVTNPVVKQLFRTDLEGDGTNEVLVAVEELGVGLLPEPGNYSLLFMQKVIVGSVETVVLGESVVTDLEGAFVVSYSVGAVADLNGDGKMEVVVDSAYFEGLGVEVWEYLDDDLGPIPFLQTGCGS